MDKNTKLTLVPVSYKDVLDMTKIMKRSFDEDTRIHLGKEVGGSPGYDNGDFIRKWYLNGGAEGFKILLDGKLIGGLNVFINDNKENYLGNIFIDPEYQNCGYGLYVWRLVEKMYSDTVKWSTDTPGFSKRNHNFYVNKCGFKIVRIENPKDKYEENYILEKEMV